jgi:hypothetical protein
MEGIIGLTDYWELLLDSLAVVECIVSQNLLWLRHGDSSVTERNDNVHR